MKNLPTRIDELRKDPAINAATLTDYLKMTQDALKASVSEYQKRAWTLLLLMVVCELLLRSLVAELSFAGLKVSDLSLIQKALPVGIAYAYYALMSVVAYRRLLEEVHDAAFEMAMPAISKHHFEWFAHPPTPFHLDKIFESSLEGPMRTAFSIMRVPFLATIVFGPPAYVMYVLSRYFSVYGLKDYYLWGAVVGALLFVLQGLLTPFALNKLAPPK
jgi:hypothetical protein